MLLILKTQLILIRKLINTISHLNNEYLINFELHIIWQEIRTSSFQ